MSDANDVNNGNLEGSEAADEASLLGSEFAVSDESENNNPGLADQLEPADTATDFVPPGEPVADDAAEEVTPPSRGLMPIVIGVVLVAALALFAVMVGTDGLVDDGEAVVDETQVVEPVTSAPTVVNAPVVIDEPVVVERRLAGVDASGCTLEQIEVKEGLLGIDRACLKLVYEDVP